MLQHTFCHIPGIGMKTERKLWEAGITSWEHWQTPSPVRLSAAIKLDAARVLQNSLVALENDPTFFTRQTFQHRTMEDFPALPGSYSLPGY